MSSEEKEASKSPDNEQGTRPDEYFEEVDDKALSLVRPKRPKKTIQQVQPIVLPPPPPPVDPIKQLNNELNRRYRPDLVPPTPLPPPPQPIFIPVPIVQPKTPSPDPVIYDSRRKRKKSPKPKEPSTSLKDRILQRLSTNKPTDVQPASLSMAAPANQQNLYHNGYAPPGMMLVPDPSYRPPQIHQVQPISSYQPMPSYQQPNVNQPHSTKINQVAPPPQQQPIPPLYPIYNPNNSSLIASNSGMSSYPLLQTSLGSSMAHGHNNQPSQINSGQHFGRDQAYALYNKQNGRIEGVIKNKLNVISDDDGENKITDEDDPEQKSALATWCAQPFCMGLTRCSGILLFGIMGFLGIGAFAGLIAAAVTYSQDSVTDSQWKILGIVVCSIMLITIIVTLIIFICCYKNGFMFNGDEDDDPLDSDDPEDADGNSRQKAVLRKIYKFNRPNDSSVTPAALNPITPGPIYQPTVHVTDKQTNTETTISRVRPRDISQGVWTSMNAYGGRIVRPLVAPKMISRVIQVFPAEIDAVYQPPTIIYEVAAPETIVSPPPEQVRYIKIPPPQPPVFEVIEKPRKPPKTQIVRQSSIEEIAPTRAPRIEYIEVDDPNVRRAVRKPQYEYVEEPKVHRTVRQPQYEYVEEVADGGVTTESEGYVEVVDTDQPRKRREKRKSRKKGVSTISVRHIKAPK